MSRLPKNVFDTPFKNTTITEPAARPGEGGRLAALDERSKPSISTVPAAVEPVAASPGGPSAASAPQSLEATDKKPERKYTVYLNDEQVLGLNEKIFALRAKGVRARDANLTKMIAAAVDYYLTHDEP